jgi:hypothetical protein
MRQDRDRRDSRVPEPTQKMMPQRSRGPGGVRESTKMQLLSKCKACDSNRFGSVRS